MAFGFTGQGLFAWLVRAGALVGEFSLQPSPISGGVLHRITKESEIAMDIARSSLAIENCGRQLCLEENCCHLVQPGLLARPGNVRDSHL